MAPNKIKEKIEDFPEERFDPDQLGTVVDLDQTQQNPIWIGLGFVALILIIFSSWAFLYLTRTKADILEEKLVNYQEISSMRETAFKAIKSDLVKREELIDSIRMAIDVTRTPIRMSRHPLTPHVPERQLAMADALEGIMRLELEGHIDRNNPADNALCLELLNTLGLQRLEYYEDGLLQRVPLLLSSWLKSELAQEKSFKNVNQKEISILENQLKEVAKQESLTVVAASYLLGRWFRFYNQEENAERCFQIGRKYVDGYMLSNKFFEGKRPGNFDPVWDEYVGCLESLAEIAFEKQKFRKARSYLVRIFNTPNNAASFLMNQSTQKHLEQTNKEIVSTELDLGTIEQALSSPKTLTSFPFFHLEDSNIKWRLFLNSLYKASQGDASSSKPSVGNLIWKQLDPAIQSQIAKNRDVKWLNASIQEDIINSLNNFLRSPELFENAEFDVAGLSLAAQANLKETLVNLSVTDIASINREIVNQSFAHAITNRYILSDGTSINNSLREKELQALSTLLKQESIKPNISQKRKEYLNDFIQGIENKKIYPRLPDWEKALAEKRNHFTEIIKQGEIIYDNQRAALRRLKQALVEIESKGNIDLETIKQIHKDQEVARNRQAKAEVQTKEAQKELKEIDGTLQGIYGKILEKKQALSHKLEALKERQAHLRIQTVNDSEPLLEQIEKQIVLRRKYLDLLSRLYDKKEGNPLRKLQEKQKVFEKQMADLRTQVHSATGNEREKLLEQVSELENKQHSVVKEFNQVFGPIRSVIEEIAESESKVWEAEKLLKETQEEILSILGTKEMPGVLQKKSQQRSKLLLIQPKNAFERQHYDKKTRSLNYDIAQLHARLNVLLQTEKLTKQTLETFYPDTSDADGLTLFTKEGMEGLVNYLTQQESLIGEYEALWQQNSLLEKIQNEERIISENFERISESLKLHKELSEKQTHDLSRLMRNIVQAKARLHSDQMKLRQLKQSPHLVQADERTSFQGYENQLIAFFNLEKEMGLDITEYRRTFEEREELVKELLEAIATKESIESQQAEAANRRDQVQFDLLVPKVVEAENRIKNLNTVAIEINNRLKILADRYASKTEEVSDFRMKLFPKLQESEKRLAVLNQKLSRNDVILDQLSNQIVGAPKGLHKVISKVDINDFDHLEKMIEKLRTQLDNLVEAQGVKQKENFYKTKSLWLIGKSSFEQSKLSSFAELVSSNDISLEMVEDENRNGKILFQEFDEKMLSDESLFFGSASVDENVANRQTWMDFLENYAIRIFSSELPKYTPKNLMGEMQGFSFEMQEDNKVYLAKARFALGEIYLTRSLRYMRSSEDAPQENARAQQELNVALSAFLAFLDFASPLMDNSFSGSRKLTAPSDTSKEFPSRKRKTLNLLNEARVYVGVITGLQNNHHKAISFYRTILSDIKREYSLLLDKETEKEEVDPIAYSQYEYDTNLHPFYISLLSRHPLGHEVLYRLGKSYAQLAELEFDRFHQGNIPLGQDKNKVKNQAERYAYQSISYFSQLILTQSFSPYRKAAHLQRAHLRQKLGDFYAARNDLVSILDSAFNEGGSLDNKDMNLKGDLPGELNPGHAYIMFELGKLYFENKDYYMAAQSFQKAQEVDHKANYVLRSKVAYTDALVAAKRWMEAHYFLKNILLDDKLDIKNPDFYYPGLLLNFAKVKKELTLFNESIRTYKEVFKFAPPGLQNGDDLDLSDIDALKKLNADYRDAIYPLGVACQEVADIYKSQYEFTKAKYYFSQAEKLFRMLKRQEDKQLRKLSEDKFKSLREELVLKSKWGQLETDVLELMYTTFARFRKVVDVDPETSAVLAIEELNQEVEIALASAEDQKSRYVDLLGILDEFRKRETLKLPEQLERERIIAKRNRDRDWGSKVAYRYDSLAKLRQFVYPLRHLESKNLMLELKRFSEPGSLEEVLLNEFTTKYAQEQLRLTAEDQASMLSANTNIENLLLMPQAEERLVDFNPYFIRWLEIEMRKTGLDDLFLPVSPQTAVLEAVDLYRVSFLAFLNDFQSYENLVKIVAHYLEVQKTDPNRIIDPERVWEMVEIASYSAEEKEDWKKLEELNRYLLKDAKRRFFALDDRSDLYRVRLGLAKSLIFIAKDLSKELPFVENNLERRLLQSKIDGIEAEAKQLLEALVNIEGESTSDTTTRIMAKDILFQFNNRML